MVSTILEFVVGGRGLSPLNLRRIGLEKQEEGKNAQKKNTC
jgi:hypothetical protein